MATLSPADVLEMVKKLPLLHQEAVGEEREERSGAPLILSSLLLSFSFFKKICNDLSQTREDPLPYFAGCLRPTELGIHYKPLFMLIFKTS